MAEILVLIGVVTVIFGVFDAMSYGDEEKDWRKPILKIVVGILAVGVGALVKFIGA